MNTHFLLSIYLWGFLLSSCGTNPGENDNKSLEQIWNYQYENLGAPNARPLIINDEMILITGGVHLTALNINDGSMKWDGYIDGQRDLDGKILLNTAQVVASVHSKNLISWDIKTGEKIIDQDYSLFRLGRNSSFENGFLMIGDTLDVYVINLDGTLKYSIDIPFASFGSSYAKGKIYLGQSKTSNGALSLGKIRAFDLETGDSLWAFATNNSGFEVAPIIENGILYASTIGNSATEIAVALNAETGEEVWKYESDYIFTRNSALGPRHYYVNTGGSLAALSKENGELKWRVEWMGTVSTKPVYLGRYVYFTNYSELMVINDETGEVVHREFSPDGTTIWHVAASSDKIFVQTSNQLIAYQPWHLREE